MTLAPDKYAPILLFTYKRLNSLKKTISALQQNFLAEESSLFVFSDNAKQEKDAGAILEVRKYLRSVSGFKNIQIIEAETNKGLAASITQGVSQIINEYGKVIVLEDDLVTSRNFLTYMNKALDFYESNPKVFSIAGFTMPIKGVKQDSVYFTLRSSSWGWATWKNRWQEVDWEIKEYEQFKKNPRERKAFNRMGSDMAGMLDKQMNGQINSWAIRWCYNQFKKEMYTVYPAVSKVINIGFTEEATHTKEKFERFKTELDNTGTEVFQFSQNVRLEPNILSQFTKTYSIASRIKYKLLNSLPFVPLKG